VLCKGDGEEATCKAGGHEFQSPQTRVFRIKNRDLWQGLPLIYNYIFDHGVPPFSRGSFTRERTPLLSLIIRPGWNFRFLYPFRVMERQVGLVQGTWWTTDHVWFAWCKRSMTLSCTRRRQCREVFLIGAYRLAITPKVGTNVATKLRNEARSSSLFGR
jgi:hypothetical protein